jgi:hypothetical protein
MAKVFEELIEQHLPPDRHLAAGRRLDKIVADYLTAVQRALRDAPMLPTEPVVQEWCLRLDNLRASGRASEVAYLHDWLNVAFGRERGETDRPLDFRIHRRLGELYMRSGNHASAARQFELARTLAPRDLQICVSSDRRNSTAATAMRRRASSRRSHGSMRRRLRTTSNAPR